VGITKKAAIVSSAAAGAVGVRALVRASRRERAEHAAEGIADTILPTVADRAHYTEPRTGDDAHAPGHAHLDRAATREEATPKSVLSRPFAKHRRGLRQPGRL
jgi:hypothetical protein